MRLRLLPATLLALVIGLGLPAPARAIDLLEALQLAERNDPNLAAVRATRAAAAEGTSISRADLLPRLVASGSQTRNTLQQDSFGEAKYDSTQWSAKLSQPLFRWDAWHRHQAAKAQRSQAELQTDEQRQSVYLGIAEAYFNVLRAEDNLTLAKAQEAAFNRQREQAEARFQVGLIARTDVLEAEAQRDAATALRLSSEIALGSARETLHAALGSTVDGLARLREQLPMTAPVPDSADAWAGLAREKNPGLLSLRESARAADAARKAQQGGFLPQVDVFTSYSSRDNGSTSNPSVNFNSGTTDVVGIEASWELFASGKTLASVRQAGLNAEAVRQQARAREFQVVNGARTGYLTVKADSARLQARQRAQASAELALEAVKAGYSVGTRNIVDLLLAESGLYAARRDYANARYDYVINTLRLHAAAGLVNEELVRGINGWLEASGTASAPGEPAAASSSPAG